MKKTIVLSFMLMFVFFIFSGNSFGASALNQHSRGPVFFNWHNSGWHNNFQVRDLPPALNQNSKGLVFFDWHKDIQIDGLTFAFSPALPIELPGIPLFYATFVQVVTTGNEVIAVTKSGMLYYFGDYNSGAIHAEGFDESGSPITLDVPINSASLVEQFRYKYDPSADPWYAKPGPDVDLVFNAELALGESTLHFLLVVKNGEVVFPRTP